MDCAFFDKGNKMRSPILLSGPKIRKAYFEASNPKNCFHRPPSTSNFRGVNKLKGALQISAPG